MTALRSRAAVCTAFGAPHVVAEIGLRSTGPGEVLVRVAACAICHSDISAADGSWGGELPAVFGHEASGIVLEVGPGVERVASGDRVVVTLIRSCGTCRSCSRGRPALCVAEPPLEAPLSLSDGRPLVQGLRTGAFADHVLVHESQVVSLPAGISPTIASLLGCSVLTGVGAAVHSAAVDEGDTVVVVGAGGVGLNCIQGAALAEAGAIVAVDPAHAKLEAARSFGATHTVDPSGEDVAARVGEITGGQGADAVLVATGAPAALESALTLLARGGTAVIVGMPATGVTLEIDPTDLAHNGRRVVGSKMGSARPSVDIPWLVQLYRTGRLALDPLVSGTFPLERIDEAIDEVKRGDALRNVILLDETP